MTMTDPIADMLTRIRNANTAKHDSVQIPSSKLKEALAKILAREGYIGEYSVKPNEGKILASASLSLEDGICTESCLAVFALRIRVSMSAMGSVIVMTHLRGWNGMTHARQAES